MAAFNRPKTANYEVHETVQVDTHDNEDHTFCGIMFPIKAKKNIPIEHLVVRKLAIRGQLGPITVWVSNEALSDDTRENHRQYSFPLHKSSWTKIYEQHHKPSQRVYDLIDLQDNTITLKPGQTRAIYIHSSMPGDEAIVYDNSRPNMNRRRRPRYEDDKIAIYSGKAHLACIPFHQMPIWGWGNAWRDHREFVGQVEYGCVYKLWNPESTRQFGGNFLKAIMAALMLQRRPTSPWNVLPDECLYYIFNMCRWDWFDDKADTLKIRRRKLERQPRQHDDDMFFDAQQNESGSPDAAFQDAQQAPAAQQQVQDMETEDEDDMEDDESDESAWERANGYRADANAFTYDDVSSDEEGRPQRARVQHPMILRLARGLIQAAHQHVLDDDDMSE